MRAALLEHLAGCERIVRDGEEVIPAWRIITTEGSHLIFTRFDHDKPGQPERAMHLMRRFMVWRQAGGFVLGMETWLGPEKTREGEEAIVVIGVSRDAAPAGAMRRIRRRAGVIDLGPVEWLAAEQIDPTFIALLPGRVEALEAGEAEELASIFGDEGELREMRITG